MTTAYEALRADAEEMPSWLRNYSPGDRFDRRAFFSSRIVYYPGAGDDGHAVKVFGSARAAHVFVYVDCSPALTQAGILNALKGQCPAVETFLGYHMLASLDLTEQDLAPAGWHPRLCVATPPQTNPHPPSFGFVAILERDANRDESHGPSRLAILFIGADGIAAYEILFCQRDGTPPPFAILLQDHGFGKNENTFGGGGLMESISRAARVLPRWLFAAENTPWWAGYEKLAHVVGDPGGQHGHPRFLCRHDSW